MWECVTGLYSGFSGYIYIYMRDERACRFDRYISNARGDYFERAIWYCTCSPFGRMTSIRFVRATAKGARRRRLCANIKPRRREKDADGNRLDTRRQDRRREREIEKERNGEGAGLSITTRPPASIFTFSLSIVRLTRHPYTHLPPFSSSGAQEAARALAAKINSFREIEYRRAWNKNMYIRV